MPFINSKISTSVSAEQEQALKTRLGQAISIVPGKSENWPVSYTHLISFCRFSGESLATNLPWAMIIIWSQTALTSDRIWELRITV